MRIHKDCIDVTMIQILARSIMECSEMVKIGAKVVSHSRYVIFQMAEVAVPRILFSEILNRIRQLRCLTIPARPG